MKKIVFLLSLCICFLKADIVTDGINLVKKESYIQDTLAGAIELYAEMYGTNPTNLNTLKTAGLLDNGFSFSGSFATSTNSFTITSTIASPQQYQIDSFLNDYARGRSIVPTVSGSNFTTTFYFGRKATYNKKLIASGVNFVQPTVPTGSPDNLWWNTATQTMYIHSGGSWRNANAKRLWIVRNTTELNASAVAPNENDGAIIYDGTTLSKQLYVGGAWRTFNTITPFNYNGAF